MNNGVIRVRQWYPAVPIRLALLPFATFGMDGYFNSKYERRAKEMQDRELAPRRQAVRDTPITFGCAAAVRQR